MRRILIKSRGQSMAIGTVAQAREFLTGRELDLCTALLIAAPDNLPEMVNEAEWADRIGPMVDEFGKVLAVTFSVFDEQANAFRVDMSEFLVAGEE